jgi:hypothetical protein
MPDDGYYFETVLNVDGHDELRWWYEREKPAVENFVAYIISALSTVQTSSLVGSFASGFLSAFWG